MITKKKNKSIYRLAIKKMAIVLYLCFFFINAIHAQEKPAPANQVKAAFLYNFTRFVNWPASSFSSSSDPFIIGIIGNDPFGQYIEELVKGEKIGNHPIIIKRYYSLENIEDSHILFINTSDRDRIRRILSIVRNKSILTVSDTENFTDFGGAVHFYRHENKIRLKINISSAKNSRLEISSKLLSLAEIVNYNR